MAINKISKDLMNELLQLFVVLYLKSNNSLKLTILEDLEKIFLLIKEHETKIFVDGTFKQIILFPGICQFKHCVAKHEENLLKDP
jgi:cystathionine beta-lyase/cystathionine gamma-synthase